MGTSFDDAHSAEKSGLPGRSRTRRLATIMEQPVCPPPRRLAILLIACAFLLSCERKQPQSAAPDREGARRFASQTGDGRTPAAPITVEVPPPAEDAQAAEQPAAERSNPAWEQRVEQVFASNLPPTQTASVLIALFPSAPVAKRAELAGRIAAVLPDDDYGKIAPLLMNPAHGAEALNTLFADLAMRPETARLPILCNLALMPNHPLAEQAKAALGLNLGQDYGNNDNQWRLAVDRRLKDLSQH